MPPALVLLSSLLGLADPPPVTTPQPADAHPGLTRPDPLDEKYPLPRNPARAAALTAERRAWYAAQLGGDLAKSPPAAAYAEAARAAVDAHADVLSRPNGRTGAAARRRDAALAAAVAAGCDLPPVLYDHRRYVKADEAEEGWIGRAAAAFTRDGYSAFRRLHANWNAVAEAHDAPPGEVTKATDDELKPVWAAAADLCRTPDRTAAEQVLVVARLALRADFLGPDVSSRYKRLAAGLDAAGAGEWLRAVADGMHFYDRAWEARGRGAGGTVTEAGARLFRQGLEAAGERFAAAHKLAPDRPEGAAGMIAVCTGLGRGRDEMETWFVRALTADPTNAAAFANKLDYLKPQWRGSRPELLAFARQCLRAATPDDGLHEMMYMAYYGGLTPGRRPGEVFLAPGVWADLRAAYEPLLAARPDEHLSRTRFFRACVLCEQWAAADAHRRRLGENWSRAEFPDPARWEAYVRLVADKLGTRRP